MEHGTALSLPGIGVMYGRFSRPNPDRQILWVLCVKYQGEMLLALLPFKFWASLPPTG